MIRADFPTSYTHIIPHIIYRYLSTLYVRFPPHYIPTPYPHTIGAMFPTSYVLHTIYLFPKSYKKSRFLVMWGVYSVEYTYDVGNIRYRVGVSSGEQVVWGTFLYSVGYTPYMMWVYDVETFFNNLYHVGCI